MELQLGLALIPTQNNPTKGFDLNRNGLEPNGKDCCLDSKILGNYNKRSFEEAGWNVKLSLVSWNGQPNEEDDGRGERKRTSYTINKNEEEDENHVVGWPPIKTWRKKLLHQRQQQGGRAMNHRETERGNCHRSNSGYVKVKMEGVPIGRKIDLRLFHSYQTLTNALISMFGKYHEKCNENNGGYKLLYQDKEGDWLLAGDVPWQAFMESVCRMEILREAAAG